MSYGIIFVNESKIANVFIIKKIIRPATYIDWFMSTFSLRSYQSVLRYIVTTTDKNTVKQKLTYNDAAILLIDIIEKYPKKTQIGCTWSLYDRSKPLGEYIYNNKNDIKRMVACCLIGLRDFYSDESMTREEKGDKKLDHVDIDSPLGLGDNHMALLPQRKH